MKTQILKINRKHFIGHYIIAVLFFWTVIIPIGIIIYTEIMVRGTTYVIDSNSITHKFKFLSIKEKKIDKKDVTDITLTQDIIQRIFNIGNLHINTAGTYLIETVLIGIDNPEEIRRMIK